MKKNILYGIIVFCVFMLLTYLLRLITGKFPEKTVLLGVYQSSDFFMGIAIALILNYSRHIKRDNNK